MIKFLISRMRHRAIVALLICSVAFGLVSMMTTGCATESDEIEMLDAEDVPEPKPSGGPPFTTKKRKIPKR